MQKLMAQLRRLYLLDGQHYQEAATDAAAPLSDAVLERHLRGEHTVAIGLVGGADTVRAMLIELRGPAKTQGSPHWERVCEVANTLQTQFALPAPAVSISGGNGYGLWLSLETPVPAVRARRFLQLLRQACLTDIDAGEITLVPGAAPSGPTLAELPPCLHRATGRWAAFINPGMGASFADEPGLDMPAPPAAQAAFLEGLQSTGAAQFDLALAALEQLHAAAPAGTAAPATVPAAPRPADGLLLKDATLDDIVRHLHEKNIEPTFRHLIAR